ncbi:MAG: Spy/CpxP family protein refolding chaperone [Deltaproteobacteria bacterium]|jgi:hypothetical protein|nr:Spy/CpxP family protein refolding chaperone [Deltaproteobacteria bacterium]
MKKIASRSTHPTSLVFAVALLALMVFGGPGLSRAATAEHSKAKAAKPKIDTHLEARIKALHAKLKITPAQEQLWNKVAQAMRENDKTMDALVEAREKNAGTMNAVQDLQSYANLVQAHANCINRFIPPFEALYASMSASQKKNADKLFRYHPHQMKREKAK